MPLTCHEVEPGVATAKLAATWASCRYDARLFDASLASRAVREAAAMGEACDCLQPSPAVSWLLLSLLVAVFGSVSLVCCSDSLVFWLVLVWASL